MDETKNYDPYSQPWVKQSRKDWEAMTEMFEELNFLKVKKPRKLLKSDNIYMTKGE